MASRSIKFVPETPGFSGYVMIKVLPFRERMAKLKDMGMTIDDLDKMSLDAKIGFFGKVLDMIESVDLTYGDQKLTSVDDLEIYAEGMKVILELLLVYAQGPSLGKPSTTPLESK